MILRAGEFKFSFPGKTLLMGVVNVTPDSFSDGGRFFSTEAAVKHGLELARQGADILDIGGESTRPRATPVDAAEESRRVLPVLRELAAQLRIPLSIDTMKPEVVEAALGAGASIVNDVGANRDDPALWKLVAASKAGYICMHMQGVPETMQLNPSYTNVVSEVNEFFGERLGKLEKHGISGDRIILDPGIGFGKNIEHNLQLLRELESLTRWDRPLMLGVSRKSFISEATGTKGVEERLAGSLACAALAVREGVSIIRTHDVEATRQALRMTEAILGRDRPLQAE
jgi:dihydropteroate synthase